MKCQVCEYDSLNGRSCLCGECGLALDTESKIRNYTIRFSVAVTISALLSGVVLGIWTAWFVLVDLKTGPAIRFRNIGSTLATISIVIISGNIGMIWFATRNFFGKNILIGVVATTVLVLSVLGIFQIIKLMLVVLGYV